LLTSIITFGPSPQAIGRENRVRATVSRIPPGRFLKERTTYKSSTRTASASRKQADSRKPADGTPLTKRCEDLGFDLNREQLDTVYHRFTTMADRKKACGTTKSPPSHEVLERASGRAPART